MDLDTRKILQQILAKIAEMDSKITRLEQGQEEIKAELTAVQELASKAAVIQELEIAKKMQLIYENQVTIIENEKKYEHISESVENLETDVFALQFAVKALNRS
ncbi:MAG: hypothetical protein RR053_02005 [Evtepia sp.]